MKLFKILPILLLSSCNMITDMYYEDIYVANHTLYRIEDPSLVDYWSIARWINTRIRYVPDEGKDVMSNPKDILERGYGDCDDFAVLFLDIVYYNLGIKMDVALVRVERSIIEGSGGLNHVVAYYNGEYIEPGTGQVMTPHKVGYIYKFDQVFN